LKKSGYLVSQALGPATAQPWRGFLTFRAESVDEVQAQLATLPLAAWLEFEIHETI